MKYCKVLLCTYKVLQVTAKMSSTMRGENSGTQKTMQPLHSCLILVTHETFSTLRGANSGLQNTIQLRHSCLIVRTAEMNSSYMKRPVQCAEQQQSPSNITKYCACHEIVTARIDPKSRELLRPIEGRFELDPTMIRGLSEQNPTSSRTHPFAEPTLRISATQFLGE